MRRRISLYIGGELADISDENLVLMNYALTDLYNPSVIRNAYSQTITLPGTPQNNRILGESFRLDRAVMMGGGSGTAFDPSARTPFTIFNELGEAMASGYCKLTDIKVTHGIPQYSVQFYGSLGSFLYGLAQKSDGEKMTLADLDYTGGGDAEFDFTINAAAVADAWDMLINGIINITASAHLATANLKTDGSTGTGGASRYVDTFPVVQGKTYKVSGRRLASTGFSGIVAFDTNGLVIGHWQDGGGTANDFVDYELTMPPGAVSIKVQGDTSHQDAEVTLNDPMWDVINFAPALNGIPANFSADKAVADPDDFGLSHPISGHNTKGGYTLVNFPAALDEWAVKDLRSYLQRPVISVEKILTAIANANNNGGWSVDLSDVAASPYLKTWLTLPMLPSLGGFKQMESAATISQRTTGATMNTKVAVFDVSGVSPNALVRAKMTFKPQITLDSTPAENALSLFFRDRVCGLDGNMTQVVFVQAIAYASDNTKVGASRSYMEMYNPRSISPSAIASAVGYTPDAMNTEYSSIAVDIQNYFRESGNVYEKDNRFTIEVEAVDIARIDIVAKAYVLFISDYNNIIPVGSAGTPAVFLANYGSSQFYNATAADYDGATAEAYIVGADTLRSGASITKRLLLSTTRTPADYLVALCRMCGFSILTDDGAKVARIVSRNTLFDGETIDLSGRVDTQEIGITPLAYDRKWYSLGMTPVGGAFEKQYKEITGRDYGSQRIDTNYNFDSEEKKLLDGVALKSAAAILDTNKYWNIIEDGNSALIPSPFIDPEVTYTLWDTADGKNLETAISAPIGTATISYFNSAHQNYDARTKAEFRDAKNSPVDGADVLLFFDGDKHYDRFALTDDLPVMNVVNDGKPCWILAQNTDGLDIPVFSRYKIYNDAVTDSLDFGVPQQVSIPDLVYDPSATISDRLWKAWLSDRLDKDGKVLRCKVDMRGLQVGAGLLRKFWYFRNAVWVLSKISNFSLTTFDLVDCEFVKVKDTTDYTNGQTI